MADVSDPNELFELELHDGDNPQDSDDDRIELDDVSKKKNKNQLIIDIFGVLINSYKKRTLELFSAGVTLFN